MIWDWFLWLESIEKEDECIEFSFPVSLRWRLFKFFENQNDLTKEQKLAQELMGLQFSWPAYADSRDVMRKDIGSTNSVQKYSSLQKIREEPGPARTELIEFRGVLCMIHDDELILLIFTFAIT